MPWWRRKKSGTSSGELVEVKIASTVRQTTAHCSKEPDVATGDSRASEQAVSRQEEPRMSVNPAFELEDHSSAGSTPEAATAYDPNRVFGAELMRVSGNPTFEQAIETPGKLLVRMGSNPTFERALSTPGKLLMSNNPAFQHEDEHEQQARETPRDQYAEGAYGRLVRQLSETMTARTSPEKRYDGIVKQITSEWSQEADEPEPQVSSSQAPSSSPSKAPSQSLLQTAEQRALAALAALTNSLGLTDGTVDAVPQQEEEVTSPLESDQPNTASAEPQPSLSTASPSRLWFSFMADPESPPVDPALPADDVREPSAASETSPADVHVQLSGPSPEPEPGGPPRKNYLSSRR